MEIHDDVNELRRIDSRYGLFCVAREYLYLALVIGGTLYVDHTVAMPTLSRLFLYLCAIALIGTGQQRLATLTHEAAHYLLLRNRVWNDIVSDWFCMFPVFGNTHSYRVQHLGHHQYPNDPNRDPNWLEMRGTGLSFDFPMTRPRFIWHCVIKQMLIPLYSLRYALARARFVSNGGEGTRFALSRHPSKVLKGGELFYLVILTGALGTSFWAALALWPLVVGLYWAAPGSWMEEYIIKGELGVRTQKCLRLTFYTLLLSGLAYLTQFTGKPCWLYFLVLWVVPLGTSFSFLMLLRQIVQHGNAGQGRFDNTRVFRGNRCLHWALFPFGNDYHVPHHLFPGVPHYNLQKLHAVLMRTEEYRKNTIVTSHSLAILDLMAG